MRTPEEIRARVIELYLQDAEFHARAKLAEHIALQRTELSHLTKLPGAVMELVLLGLYVASLDPVTLEET